MLDGQRIKHCNILYANPLILTLSFGVRGVGFGRTGFDYFVHLQDLESQIALAKRHTPEKLINY